MHAKDTELLPERRYRGGINGDPYRFRIPGYGAINWTTFIAALDEIGYTGGVAIEHEDPLYSGERFDEGLTRVARALPAHPPTGKATAGATSNEGAGQMSEHSGRRWNYLSLDLLLGWSARLAPLMQRLARHAPASARHLPSDEINEDLCHLYALSRVNDYLTMPFQPDAPNPQSIPAMPQLSAVEYQQFWESLGVQLVQPDVFHPFYHEIAGALQADDPDEPIGVLDKLWPGLLFGDLLIARAGVTVWGGARHVRADIAPQSCLYFAHRRRYRPTTDLSIGWGSNSQWATSLRRDYRDAQAFYYNVDGTLDVWVESTNRPRTRDDLTPTERYELLRNRCFIVSARPPDDQFPYDDTAVERRDA